MSIVTRQQWKATLSEAYKEDIVGGYVDLLEEAIAVEREQCAQLCEEMAKWHSKEVVAAYESAAEAIRARGQG